MARMRVTFLDARPLWMAALVALTAAVSTREAHAQQNNTTPIAWINSQLILQQAPGYAAAESTFAKEFKAMQDEVEKLQRQLDSAVSLYQQQEIALSPSAKKSKRDELTGMQGRLEQRRTELSNKSQQRERELVGPIEDRVKGVIEGVRAERNVGILFDVSAQGNNIVAADRTLDLTQLVIQRLKGSTQAQ